ncbi:MAG: hypothetical protein AAB875_04295, partial [Patescibacteria group bacterium]
APGHTTPGGPGTPWGRLGRSGAWGTLSPRRGGRHSRNVRPGTAHGPHATFPASISRGRPGPRGVGICKARHQRAQTRREAPGGASRIVCDVSRDAGRV